ncbi:hypothetical protein TRICI_003004 [Trichomonascus ciferrii]|uniref:Uncharacterized protein n=1 Tax=Trichomonascus ciferrii TaxID=44093 RepID=A0A642V676_9ASCO|nr:hypothetical protein TRICI_003004 [Trichomonascus ciferrii]
MEKNQYEDMKNKGEKHIAVLKELIERTKRGEDVNVEEELAIVNDQSRSVEEILQEIEKLDQEWSSSVEKQIEAPEQAQPKQSKSRSDVKGTFV